MPLPVVKEKENILTNIEVEKILTDVQNQINEIKYAHEREEIVRDEELVSAGNIVEINNIFENSLVKKDTFSHVNKLLFDLHENIRQKKNILEIEENIDKAESGVISNISEFMDLDESNEKAKQNIDGLKKLKEDRIITEYAYDKLSKKIGQTPEGKIIEKVETIFNGFKQEELENAGKYLPIANSEELKTALEDLNKQELKKKEMPSFIEKKKLPEENKDKKNDITGTLKFKKPISTPHKNYR